MIQATCLNCQAKFNLKDEFAGKKGKCANCQSVFIIPEVNAPQTVVSPSISETRTNTASEKSTSSAHEQGIFKNHIYGVKQKRIAINEKYYIKNQENSDVFFSIRRIYFWKSLGAILGGIVVIILGFAIVGSIFAKENPIMLLVWFILAAFLWIAAIIALYPKRHIEFYFEENDTNAKAPEFIVSQDKKLEFPTKTYTLRDSNGNTVAKFHKNIFTDILRKTWHIEFAGKHVVVKEESIILGLLRRWMPFGQLIRTNFIFIDATNDPKSSNIIGYFKRKFEIFDNYMLDMTRDPTYVVPRQFALCMAVLLDSGEKR